MLNEPAALTAAHLPDMMTLPRTEADLLLAVFRAARKYLNISRGIARGDAFKARRKLLDLVKDGGDPAKLAVAALIDGGSSGSIDLDVVSAGGVFKDSAHTQNSRIVIPARIGAVDDSRPASPGREDSSLFDSGPAVRSPQNPAGPLFRVRPPVRSFPKEPQAAVAAE